MIRPNNRFSWVVVGIAIFFLAVLVIPPLHQLVGALIWDPIIVPLYAGSAFLIRSRLWLCGLGILIVLLTPFLLSPLWDVLRLLDNAAMRLARFYYNSQLVHYGLEAKNRYDRDIYVLITSLVRRIGHLFAFMRSIPILNDLHKVLFNNEPSSRVTLLLLNRIHEASYLIALGKDPLKNFQRWQIIAQSTQALAAHTLAGSGLSANSRLIGALLSDDLHSQAFVMAGQYGLSLTPRLQVWRRRAIRLYKKLGTELPAENPWRDWIAYRLLWFGLFNADDDNLNWNGLPIVIEQFWRLTELAGSANPSEGETRFGMAIAAAHRMVSDLVALQALGNSPGAADLLQFGTDVGYWLDSSADQLRATIWHQSPSSRASELPPCTFLASQLYAEIQPKWATSEDQAPSNALRGQLIAARGVIYSLIRSGWRSIVPDASLAQAQTFAKRAADEISVEDEFGARS